MKAIPPAPPGAFPGRRRVLLLLAFVTTSLLSLCGEGAVADSPDGKAWGAALLIENGSGDVHYPAVAMDAGGNATAAWSQSVGARFAIMASRYTAGRGWDSAPTPIGHDNTGDAWEVRLSADRNGNVVAVWYEIYPRARPVEAWANRYVPGAGWGTATRLSEAGLGNAYWPRVAVDGSGNAFALWQQPDGIRTNIWAARFDVSGNRWEAPVTIATDNSGQAKFPVVGADDAGNAVVLWIQSDGGEFHLWANRYEGATKSWGKAARLESAAVINHWPALAVDPGGRTGALWGRADGSVRSGSCDVSTGVWTTPVAIDNQAGAVGSLWIAPDGTGDFAGAWQKGIGTNYSIRGALYTPAARWASPVRLDSRNNDAYAPEASMDSAGNVFVVWRQGDGTRSNIWWNRHSEGRGWETARTVPTSGDGDVDDTHVAGDGKGNVVAIWMQSDGTRNNIWVNLFR